jgi:hypothetical protein
MWMNTTTSDEHKYARMHYSRILHLMTKKLCTTNGGCLKLSGETNGDLNLSIAQCNVLKSSKDAQ